ncbi:MAG TPA: cyclic nucleotide-binding domain-containing protein, partial [Candidatus Baltobacteraceae bacterium]|nr:cyclic nucleotide-binding domain-containing protein [Candidatus Baltobacteraceae bacterium]
MAAAKKLESFELDQTVPFLKNTVLFRDAGDDALRLIAARLERVHYKKGDPIVLENEMSDHVYFLFSGSAEVVKNVPELNRMTRLAMLKPGDPFSEFSVLNRSTKSASVFALEDCTLFRMSGQSFLDVLGQLPLVAKSLATHIARLTEHVQSSRLNVDYTQPERIALHPQIPKIFPQTFWRRFEVLPIRFEHQCLFVAMKNPQSPEFFQFMAGRMPNLPIYVSLIGSLDFDLLEKELTAGYGSPVEVPATAMPSPITGEPIEWLSQLAIFREIPRDWLSDLAQNLNRVQFSAGQIVYRRGDPSEFLYIIQSGIVSFSFPIGVANAKLTGGSVYVGSASPGDYISEVSLLNQSAHLLTAKAATDTVLYTLPKDIFHRLLETPYLSLPLACDLALQFQTIRSHSFPF